MGLEIKENLELVLVNYDEDSGKKVTLDFYDEENEEIRDVSFNLRSYDKDKEKFVDDHEREEERRNQIRELFDCEFEELEEKVGTRMTVYCTDTFNSLTPVEVFEKFPMEMKGEIIMTQIDDIVVDDTGIKIRYEYEDKKYESKMMYSKYIESMHKFVKNPHQVKKQYEKFKEKFGVEVEEKEELIGKPIMVEVKIAGGKWTYGDIKKLKTAKKD